MSKKAYIMRGLPGSGKSTRARELAGESGAIHSTDSFFEEDGVYNFQPQKLAQAHARNLLAFCRSLATGIPVLICDNCNIEQWEWSLYEEAARGAGYDVAICDMPRITVAESLARNTHGVPAHTILNMSMRYRPAC